MQACVVCFRLQPSEVPVMIVKIGKAFAFFLGACVVAAFAMFEIAWHMFAVVNVTRHHQASVSHDRHACSYAVQVCNDRTNSVSFHLLKTHCLWAF